MKPRPADAGAHEARGEVRSCPACRGAASRPGGQAGDFAMRTCADCRTLFTDHLPTALDAKDYENWDYYRSGLDVPDFVLRRLGQIVRGFGVYRHSNRWLDVGCGAGTLMRAALAEGWDVVGTEVATAAAEAVRKTGLDVRVGTLEDVDLPPGGFDVVSLVEVIEHVADPQGLLAQAAALVRPGGALYVTTPHARGISGRLLGNHWSIVSPPEHLQLFSVQGLDVALRAAGLVRRSVRTHAVNPYELVAALRSKGGDESFAQHTATSYRLNEPLSTKRSGVVLKASINAVLSTTRLGDALKVVAERPDIGGSTPRG